jgi:hypothetical protein
VQYSILVASVKPAVKELVYRLWKFLDPVEKQQDPARGSPVLLAFAMFKEFDLAEALQGFFPSLVRAAHILSLAGQYLIAAFYFLNHHQTSVDNRAR